MEGNFFKEFMHTYGRAWNLFDLAGIMSAYHTPCFIYKNETVFALTTEDAKTLYFTELLASYRQQGYAKADISEIDLKHLGQKSVLASVHWICLRDDDSVMADFWDSYHLITINGKWKILDDTVHE